MIPKYLIVYDEELKFNHSHRLPMRGVYQKIVKALDGKDKIMIYSTSFGMGGGIGFIDIHNKHTLNIEYKKSFNRYVNDNFGGFSTNTIVDVTMYDDRVFYLKDYNCLYEWYYNNYYSKKQFKLQTDIPIRRDMKSIVFMDEESIVLRNDSSYQLLSFSRQKKQLKFTKRKRTLR